MNRQTLFVESDRGGPIYIVPCNMGTHIYIARHLACSHTVKKLQYALEYLPKVSPAREVRYYDPLKDHEDDFFVVINTVEATSALTHRFPFEALREYTATTTSVDSIQVQRQASNVNHGFTSLMSMGDRALNGVPVPKLKQGTADAIFSYTCSFPGLVDRSNQIQNVFASPSRYPQEISLKAAPSVMWRSVLGTRIL
jgi:hypothetical protein